MGWMPSIKAKLLTLLLLTIFSVLAVVGTLLSIGVERFHREETLEVFAAAQRSLRLELENRQGLLVQAANRLAADELLQNSLHQISLRGSQAGSNPRALDGEKKRIAVELARGGGSTQQALLAALDGAGQLVAFGRADGNSVAVGLLAFDAAGMPVPSLQDPSHPSRWRPGAVGEEIKFMAQRGRQALPAMTLVRTPRGLMLLASAPVFRLDGVGEERGAEGIEREPGEGRERPVGRILVGQVLGEEFLTQIARYTPIRFGLLFQGGDALGEVAGAALQGLNLTRSAPLLADGDDLRQGWQELPAHFLKLLSLPLSDGETAYPVLVLEKEAVNKQIHQTLRVLLLVLLASAALVIPMGLAVANRAITRPVVNLVESVDLVKEGRYEQLPGAPEGRGEFARLFSSLKDMADTIRSREEQLRLWAKVLEQSREAIFVTDEASRILLVNRAFVAITGYAPEEALGQTPKFLQSGRHDAEFYRAMWQSLRSNGHWQGELWDRAKDGRIYPQWVAITAVADEPGVVTNYIAIFSDLTEHKAAQERIQFLAQHDSLTELPNRLLLQDRLAMAVAVAARDGHQVGVLFVDLDRFKTINDSLGHTVGDELIKEATRRLKDAVRESDTVARLGGDEFIVVLHRIRQAEDAGHVADGILAHLAQPFSVAGQELRVTASIGISLFPSDGEDAEGLIKNADTAMFHAKERGRNNYQFFRREMNAKAGERLALENALRGAVARHEFVLFYQPQVEIRSGRVIGAEALIRWQREEGFVSPADFIPLAEETGCILEIGDWVLREACRQQQVWDEAWPARGLRPVPVAVNLSALQFRQKLFRETLLDILAEHPLPAGRIELELTESIVMEDPEQVETLLDSLKQAGLRLSIDDFGTGYSSLSYLKRFPLDKLKIDASFVRNIVNDSADLAIVHAVVSLGHSLGLRVVAEGVEGPAELQILHGMGCDVAQGYYFSRPVPAAEFEAWLASYAPQRMVGSLTVGA
ncbi:hypothetical protein AZSI13_07390 [Azospira sp. I13]|nr:hypothetical protein AZSI13_07390 [Azospira sp. I13]